MRKIQKKCVTIFIALNLMIGIDAAPLLEESQNITQAHNGNDPEYGDEYFEGDMMLAHHRTGVIDAFKRWPNNIVYFKVDEAFSRELHEQILMAMMRIERDTCIKFMPTSWRTPNYVYINGRSAGCGSEIGYRGGVQLINLQLDRPGNGCFKFGTILHELLHTLGMVHQQSAPERDSYVTIFRENIREENMKNFDVYSPFDVSNFGVPYDFYSVMHYSSYAFSKNGQKTIVATRDPNIAIGQRTDLSAGDILKLNRMYNCRQGRLADVQTNEI